METSENMEKFIFNRARNLLHGTPAQLQVAFCHKLRKSGKWKQKLEPQQYIELRKLWQKKKKKNYNGRKTLHWGKWEVETKMEPHEYIELKKLWRGKKN